ncbi:hypothetical protein [Streptomyces sp. NPDC056308]|uniref:hypothetical protein n=1 Tax=Streptomyces sp. NPDC056308 TaxID=3345780 RepID=UPI0035E20D46
MPWMAFRSGISNLWDSEIGNAGVRAFDRPVEGREFVARGIETDSESFRLAEPAVVLGLVDAVGEAADDLDETATLGGGDPQHGTADAGVFVFAGRPVGAPAGAQLDLPKGEVALKLLPFLVRRLAILGFGPKCTSLSEEGSVGADEVVLEDG